MRKLFIRSLILGAVCRGCVCGRRWPRLRSGVSARPHTGSAGPSGSRVGGYVPNDATLESNPDRQWSLRVLLESRAVSL